VCIRHQERKIFEFSNKQQKNITQPWKDLSNPWY
jgi:hypothetical protein